jgi:transcriptional regulator of acetoin/glycerol metabolism
MDEAQEIIRCRDCELIQWRDRENCRHCGAALPKPIVKIVENVVQKIIVRRNPQCLEELQQARQLRAAASESLAQSDLEPVLVLGQTDAADTVEFPTMAEMERTMILAAYRRTNRRPLEAARLLGIGKTTFYRKLRESGSSVS